MTEKYKNLEESLEGPVRPWPEGYEALLPAIREQWAVVGNIFLNRVLSGLSGAKVYAADLTCRDFSGQAILKLDKAGDPRWKEMNEAERHQRAIEVAPAFAEKHLPSIVHTLQQGEQIAILSTIAGRALEYATPWAFCPHDQQLAVVRELSVGLLEDWNQDYRLADGMQAPDELLRAWLIYRLDPVQGHIHSFLKETCGLSAETPSFTFEGRWYPNPLAFACAEVPLSRDVRLRALKGNSHGDLHGFNVLVPSSELDGPHYYLIDLALYSDDQFLFYDHAYFELSYLVRARDKASPAEWNGILDTLRTVRDGQAQGTISTDDLGLIQLVAAWRKGVLDWVHRHEGNRQSNVENQYLLARVAIGLNFVNKPLSDDLRRVALLFAASNLKRFLKFNNLDWPKHGPALEFPEQDQSASPVADAPAPAQPAAPQEVDHEADSPAQKTTAVDQDHEADAPVSAPAPRVGPKVWTGAALGLALALGVGLWAWSPWGPSAVPGPTAGTSLPLSSKPSIVVLPFDSFSPGAENAMLADGMTATITAALAQVPDLFVTSRSSAVVYKDQGSDPRDVASTFNVRYVLEGSLQTLDNRVRVLAELVDTESGQSVWAERYDREPDDIFALQDEIALHVLISLQVKLTEGYQAAIRGESTSNVEAYLLYTRAQQAYRTFTSEAMDEVQRLVNRIDKLDPSFREAKVLKAWSYIADARFGHSLPNEAPLETAAALLREAAEIDGTMSDHERAEILIADAYIALSNGHYDQAAEAGKTAADLDPNNADLLATYGQILFFLGDHAQSIAFLRRAIQLSPTHASWYALYLSRDYAFEGDSERALDWAKKGVALAESDLMRALNLANLVFADQAAGRAADGKSVAQEILELAPTFTLESYRRTQPYRDEADWQRYADALRAAGIP